MDIVADFLRSELTTLTKLWEVEVRRESDAAPVLQELLPMFLSALAEWMDGNTERAERDFIQLTEGPALQQLGYGVGLETLTREYSKLRFVLVGELLAALPATHLRDALIRLQQGMDYAIDAAIRRYAARREEVRERFISILGHDLRDPLSTVVISARTLAANPEVDREHRLVATRVVRACNRMQRMINDVLDFARGHLGTGIPALRSPNDMGEICRAAADEIIAANPQREVRVDISGDLQGDFDRDRVHQALTNLLANAIHHGEGPIEVHARGKREIVTEVTSYGPPIPEALRDQLFDPFAQGDSPRQGLGLGLYIVSQIAIAHGARCEVTSDERSTTFRIRWPRGERRRAAC